MNEASMSKEQLDTPTLWVDLDDLEENISTLAAHFKNAGVQWRPHVKGIKIPAIAHRLIAAGAVGVTCAKLSEAEVMAGAGIKDILIANEIVGTLKIARLVQLRQYTQVKVAVDNAQNAVELGQAAAANDVEIGVLVDVNTGMNRTGVAPGAEVVALSRLVHETPGLRYMGLMSWEGHTIGFADTAVKEEAIHRAVGLLVDSAAQCRAAGLPVTIVSAGGSGTYKITPFIDGITEIQAGGAIFSDVAYESWGVETKPCLFMRTIVSSRPAPDRIIFDAGYKAMPAWHAQPRPLGIEGVKSFVASAEHGILTLCEANTEVEVGTVVDFIVGYTDATLYLHDKLYGIRKGIVEVAWEISGRGKLN